MAGAFVPSLTRSALLMQTLLVGGLAFGRVVSVSVDGVPNPFMLMLLALESTIALLSLAFLLQRGKTPDPR